jgi:hypothetical protein
LSKKCHRCSLILYTKHCEKGHLKLCNGKGHFGWYCAKCKHFTYKTQKFNSSDLKKKHKCGVTICRICRQSLNPEEIHLCPLREEKPTKFWPLLSFLSIEFSEINSDDCSFCYELKNNFKQNHNFTWKQVFESKSFPTLCCTEHLNRQVSYKPLIFLINKENRANRGSFSSFLISNICKSTSTDQINHKYFESIKVPSKFVPIKTISSALKDIKTKLNLISENITKQFLSLIIDEEWTNSTIVINDEDSIQMVIIYFD